MVQKIGLFGGSFNPIHNGHLHIARAFAEELALDNVIFLPAGNPYHKSSPQVSAQQRLKMVELAIEDNPRFAVSDCDIIRTGATYTYDTVQIFRQLFPNAQLWWLMGMDSLLKLHTWKNWRGLVQQIHIAVAARQGENLNDAPIELRNWINEALSNHRLQLLKATLNNISSTTIRNHLATNHSCNNQLPEKVANYIHQYGLYSQSSENTL